MLLHMPQLIETFTSHQKAYVKLTADNFYQDCKAFDKYHKSYEYFMDKLILTLIESQYRLFAINTHSQFSCLDLKLKTPHPANIITLTEESILTTVTTYKLFVY